MLNTVANKLFKQERLAKNQQVWRHREKQHDRPTRLDAVRLYFFFRDGRIKPNDRIITGEKWNICFIVNYVDSYFIQYLPHCTQHIGHCPDRPMGIDSGFYAIRTANILEPFGQWRESPYRIQLPYSRLYSLSLKLFDSISVGRHANKLKKDKLENIAYHIGIDISALMKSLNDQWPFRLNLGEEIFKRIVFHSAFRQRLGVIIFVKSRFVRFLVNALLRIILPVYENFSLIITKGFEICFRYEMMTFLFHAAISTKT